MREEWPCAHCAEERSGCAFQTSSSSSTTNHTQFPTLPSTRDERPSQALNKVSSRHQENNYAKTGPAYRTPTTPQSHDNSSPPPPTQPASTDDRITSAISGARKSHDFFPRVVGAPSFNSTLSQNVHVYDGVKGRKVRLVDGVSRYRDDTIRNI